MKTVLRFNTAVVALLVVMGVFLTFHLFVVAGVVPQNIVWGGRTSTRAELLQMEAVSITILAVSSLAIWGYARLRRAGRRALFLRGVMWLLAILFTLNTVGNLMAKTAFERLAFTPVTLILAVLALRVAIEPTA